MTAVENTIPEKEKTLDDVQIAKELTERQDAFNRKWASPMLLGPFLPAIFSIIVIVGGNVTLNSGVGICGYPLKDFLGGAIFLSYLFLILYSWVFLGDHYSLYIPFRGASITILKPITSLRFLVYMYGLLGLGSFICWCIGSYYMSQGIFCADTAPKLYSFCLFIVVVYWLQFFIIIFYIMKLNFGRLISTAIMENTREPTEDELEEQIFRKKFQALDTRRRNRIAATDLPLLFAQIGIYIPDEDIPDLQQQLDPNDLGDIEFYTLLKWFKAFRGESNKAAARVKKAGPQNDKDDDDDDDKDD